jgi:hypothetical protein
MQNQAKYNGKPEEKGMNLSKGTRANASKFH